jgi:hypothetical protein
VRAAWQTTAIDVATRWLVARLIVGDKSPQAAARFLDQVQLVDVGVELTVVLTDTARH